MAILIDRHTKVIAQGLTEETARLHTRLCRSYAEGRQCFVAGVDARMAGEKFDGMPVYYSVREAMLRTGATVSAIDTAPRSAIEAIEEAVDAGIELVVCIGEGIPDEDMARLLARMKGTRTRLLGPAGGIITPGGLMIGTMPERIHKPGCIGIVSRSVAIMCDAAGQLTHLGLGQSTCVGIGRGQGGLDLVDVMRLFNDDPDTEVVVMIGGPDGDSEERCGGWIRDNMKKPVVGFVAGGKAAEGKLAVMEECGIVVTRDQPDIGVVVRSVLYDDSFWMIG